MFAGALEVDVGDTLNGDLPIAFKTMQPENAKSLSRDSDDVRPLALATISKSTR